jgi:hypothetical protein
MKKLRPLQLAAIIFLTVSGGPYGLESLLSYVGSHGALLLLILNTCFMGYTNHFGSHGVEQYDAC